jgi:hypothetical protein
LRVGSAACRSSVVALLAEVLKRMVLQLVANFIREAGLPS